MRKLLMFSAAAMAIVAGPAMADMLATATTDLNVRAGPGTQYPVIGVLGAGQSINVEGCLSGGGWCKVSEGWASAKYLSSGMVSSAPVIAYEGGVDTETRIIERRDLDGGATGSITGGAAGAIAGGVVGGPAGAAIGGVAGFVGGGAAGSVLDPPDRVRTYVRSNRIRPLRYERAVTVGTTLPDTVELGTIPDYEYRYSYVNDRPVLVEPRSRRIVYVYD
jgi:hypothetical protein